MTRALCALALVALGACTCGGEEAPAPEIEGAKPSQYFPMHLGDRWSYVDGGGLAVTALTESGVGVFFGSDRTSAERYVINEVGEVLLVDPTDRPIATWLAEPMELGHSWRYTIGDTTCEARYATLEVDAPVAGLEIHGCVEVRRRCQMPTGKPFPDATAELREETWCPYVGRVDEVVRFDPLPNIEGFPEERRFRVSQYRVEGAVAPPEPETFDCGSFLLLQTDIQAACGPHFYAAESPDPEEGNRCSMRFEGGGDSVTVTALRTDDAATDEDVDALSGLASLTPPTMQDGWRVLRIHGARGTRIVPPRPGSMDPPQYEHIHSPEKISLGFADGRFALSVRLEGSSCSLEQAKALQPLLRSLVSR